MRRCANQAVQRVSNKPPPARCHGPHKEKRQRLHISRRHRGAFGGRLFNSNTPKFAASKDESMNNEQVPSEKVRSLQPEATHIARVAHNLILSVFVVAQVSFSSSPPITRVAIIRGLHITASTGFEGHHTRPSHNCKHGLRRCA